MTEINDRNATIGFPSSEFISCRDGSKVTLEAGYRFDTFELVELLGRGGMGEVWKARDLEADRIVAIKFVPRDIQRYDEEMDRVRETFGKIHALQDRHICPLYFLKSDEHLGTYLVMKFIDGISLTRFRRKFERFPLEKAIETLKPVAHALDSAHQQGVIHRDIKPSNILIVTDQKNEREIVDVQLIDFGLAAEIRRSMTRVSQGEVNVSGTRPYMAPEQWRARTQDAATDQYALAVVAHELLADHLPFDADDIKILRECVLHEEPERIEGVPEHVNAALKRGLAKERQERFSCCRDFIDAMTGEKKHERSFEKRAQNAFDRINKALLAIPFSEVVLGAIAGGTLGLAIFRFSNFSGWLLGLLIGAITGFVVERMSRRKKAVPVALEKSRPEAEQETPTQMSVVEKQDKPPETIHWTTLLVAVPCLFIATGFGAVAGGAIGAGIGLLAGMPQVFAPLGGGIGMIAAWGSAWELAKKIKF